MLFQSPPWRVNYSSVGRERPITVRPYEDILCSHALLRPCHCQSTKYARGGVKYYMPFEVDIV